MDKDHINKDRVGKLYICEQCEHPGWVYLAPVLYSGYRVAACKIDDRAIALKAWSRSLDAKFILQTYLVKQAFWMA